MSPTVNLAGNDLAAMWGRSCACIKGNASHACWEIAVTYAGKSQSRMLRAHYTKAK